MEYRYTFPGGKRKALTFSYDDGAVADRRLVEIFNRYGMKGTFHLNSMHLLNGDPSRISGKEASELYFGHEISCHGKTHPFFSALPTTTLIQEVREDRLALEKIASYPVRGMSYPFGDYSKEVIGHLRNLGIVYSRTVQSTGKFVIPEDFMEWHPTAHHNSNIAELGKTFLESTGWGGVLQLCYIWGHSYEFERAGNWSLIEAFCAQMSENDQLWYATNIEIYEYIQACRLLITSMDSSRVRNSSAISVWLEVDGKPLELKSGAMLDLSEGVSER